MSFRQRFRLVILLLCAFTSATSCAYGDDPSAYDPHHVDGSNLGGLIDLSQSWLVYGGDDPRFADPAFDDSHWQVASLSHHLSDYGIHNQPVVWYRIHVAVPPSAQDLSLNLYQFRGSMEAYVNGVRIGQIGKMTSGGQRRENNFYYLMPIPRSALNGGMLVIAVRAAIGEASRGEIYHAGIGEASLGPSSLLHDKATLYVFEDLSSNVYRLILQAITIFILVALVFALPRQHEYLMLAMAFLFAAADNVGHILTVTRFELFSSSSIQLLVDSYLGLGSILFFLEFVNLALGKTRVRWIRMIQAYAVLSVWMSSTLMTLLSSGHLSRSPALNAIYFALQVLNWLSLDVFLPGIVLWEWKRGRNNDAGLLLIPWLLSSIVDTCELVGNLLVSLHVISLFPQSPPIFFLRMQWGEISDVSRNLALLVYIILRVVRTVREGARFGAEVEAAQTVQKVLLARSQQATPGFKVDTVYLPASEVGGDFFLVSPGADGSLLAIVGDVAGKGMLAAMRVSVILGILRREDSRVPGTVLQRLNDAMILQGDMGLTTACCVRMEPDGRFTVANAGHISPYIAEPDIAGREVASAGALPLGIAPEQEYEQMEGSLANGEALVLMSDGVVEARSPSNELYGFERLPALTQLPAAEIANTAKLFGQEDDITVMTLSCLV